MVAVVDPEERVDKLLSAIDAMVSGGCLIAISDVTVDVTVVGYEQHQGHEVAAPPVDDARLA